MIARELLLIIQLQTEFWKDGIGLSRLQLCVIRRRIGWNLYLLFFLVFVLVEDLKTSPAELLYGTTLRIPGEFFIEEDFPVDPEIFLEKHRIHMRNIRSSPTNHYIKRSPFVHKNLYDCTHVWLREDAVKKSLQPPYSGPYLVIKRISDYLFSIDILGKIVNVLTERLKPIFLPKEDSSTCSSSTPSPLSTTTTTSIVPTASTPATTLNASSTPSPVSIRKPLRTYPDKKKVYFAT